MKRLMLFILMLAGSLGAVGQTTLPASSKLISNQFYQSPAGGVYLHKGSTYNPNAYFQVGNAHNIDSLLGLKIDLVEKAVPNGVATLDITGKVPLSQINDALIGSVNYRGPYNIATNTPALPAAASGNKGWYYLVEDLKAVFAGDSVFAGDWVISNGSAWASIAKNRPETDPTVAAWVKAITTTNISNWNTAYGWGNHAGLYPSYTGAGASGTWGINITGNSATTAMAANSTLWSGVAYGGPYVTIAGTETIIGAKTFSAGTTINNTLTLGVGNGINIQNPSGNSNASLYNSGGSGASILNITAPVLGTTAIFSGNLTVGGFIYDSSNSEILAGADGSGFYFASGASSVALPIYIGSASTTVTNIRGATVAFPGALTGSGDRLVATNSVGTIASVTIGTGLSYSGGVLSATGGATGTVTGTGTAGYIGKWTSASNMANSIMSESGSTITVAGDISANRVFSQGGSYGLVQSYNASGEPSIFRAFSGSSYFDIAVRNNVNGNQLLFGKDLEVTGSVLMSLTSGGVLSATSFSGAGTGLTGTATSLTSGNSNALGGYTLAFSNVVNTIPLRDGSGGITAASFIGSGASLTGTASGLSIGGNAATATNSTQWGGWINSYASAGTTLAYLFGGDGSVATQRYYTAASVQSFLGLGSNAYTSIAYYPNSNPSGFITGINSGNVTTALGYAPVNPSSLGSLAYSSATIPTLTSQLSNDAGFITSVNGVFAKGNLLIGGDGTTTTFNTGFTGGTAMVVSPSIAASVGLDYYLEQISNVWYIHFSVPPANGTTIRFYAIVS